MRILMSCIIYMFITLSHAEELVEIEDITIGQSLNNIKDFSQKFVLRGLQGRNDDNVIQFGIRDKNRTYTYSRKTKDKEIRIYIVNDNVEGIAVMKKGFLEQCSIKVRSKWKDSIISEKIMETVGGQTISFKLESGALERIECSQFEMDIHGKDAVAIREYYGSKILEATDE